MEVMQFSKEEVREVLRLLAGILHLGNIEFITAGGAQVSFKTGKMAPPSLLLLGFASIGKRRSTVLPLWPFTEKMFDSWVKG